jgi:hypothetical protein
MSTPQTQPPPIQPAGWGGQATPPSSFARQAATFSLVAPFASVFISLFLQPSARGHRAAMMILGLVSVLLILLGFVLGISSLVSIKRHGNQGELGKAVAGTCICGLLVVVMLVTAPALLRAVKRAKEKQQMEQRQE